MSAEWRWMGWGKGKLWRAERGGGPGAWGRLYALRGMIRVRLRCSEMGLFVALRLGSLTEF